MDPAEDAREDDRRLRRVMRDVVALSSLPAVWIGLGRQGIARSLADVLLSTLALDLIYIRLGENTAGSVEIVRTKHRHEGGYARVKAALDALLKTGAAERHYTIPNPFGAGTLRAAVTRFGGPGDHGVLVAGSRNADFPTEQDRLLLGVGANQTAVVLRQREAEQRVQEQREWLAVTLASIGDAVVTTDVEGRITYMNPVAEELAACALHDVRQKPLEAVVSLVHDQTRQPLEHPVQKVLRDGTAQGASDHTILVASSGTEQPVDGSAAPIRDSDGRMIGVVMVFRAVATQRRAAQLRNVRLAVTQALNGATSVQDMASKVLRAIGDGLAWDVGLFWSVDGDADRLVCRTVWHRDDASLREFSTASRARAFTIGEGLLGRVWAGREAAWIPDVSEDGHFVRAVSARSSGLRSAFACPVVVDERCLGVIEFFVKHMRRPDADLLETMATVTGHVGQFIERQTASDELRRSETELADFFENATVGLHWVGPDGIILRANRAELEMLGYTREEYVGRPIADFHADEDVICDILDKLSAGEKLADYPARLRCKDGSVKDVLIDSSVMWTHGRFVHTRCFTRDVTKRKKLEEDLRLRVEELAEANRRKQELLVSLQQSEEKLRDADRRKDEFLATLAHELRNPLAPLRNSLQILRMPRLDTATMQQALGMMERQVQSLVRLVDDLLDVARVMRGKIELRKEPVELASVVARAVETAQSMIEAQGHQLELAIPHESLLVDADPVRLAQVISNLLTNSAKYTEAKGHIWLSAARVGEEVILRVRDDGIGIAHDVLPHVFDLFVQAEHAFTKSQGGLGIGLTLVKNLTQLHGGTVEARSAGLGKGSEFSVRLPLSVHDPRALPAHADEPADESRPSGHRLLVVDDNRDAAVSLATLLRLKGHDVRVAHDGPSALAMASAFRPSVVFLDIGMPDMDGYEVARRMRQQAGSEPVVFAALTGWGQEEDRRRTLAAGFDHHLVKPPEPMLIESLLENL